MLQGKEWGQARDHGLTTSFAFLLYLLRTYQFYDVGKTEKWCEAMPMDSASKLVATCEGGLEQEDLS